MRDQEGTNVSSYKNGARRSTNTKGNGTLRTERSTQPSRTPVVVSETPQLGLNAQFKSVIAEHLTSVSLLNSSGEILLKALNQMVPPEGSERALGEYTSHAIRKISKSLCDLVITKSAITKELYSIARDEK